MIANDLYVLRNRAGLKQKELLPHLPLTPSGRKITTDFLGRIERGEVDITEEMYIGIRDAINNLASKRTAAA